MYGAGRIANSRLAYSAVFLNRLHSGFKVSYVVKRVENPYNGNAVIDARLYELFYHVVGIMFISEQVLSA